MGIRTRLRRRLDDVSGRDRPVQEQDRRPGRGVYAGPVWLSRLLFTGSPLLLPLGAHDAGQLVLLPEGSGATVTEWLARIRRHRGADAVQWIFPGPHPSLGRGV